MTVVGSHSICRQKLDVTFNGAEQEGLSLQNRLSDWCGSTWPRLMEKMLDTYAPQEAYLCIDELTIEVESIPLEDLEKELEKQLTVLFEEAIRQKIHISNGANAPKDLIRTGHQKTIEAFCYFLQSGQLPWSFRVPAGKTLDELVREAFAQNRYYDQTLILHALLSEVALRRLVSAFSKQTSELVLAALSSENKAVIKQLLEMIKEKNYDLSMDKESLNALPSSIQERIKAIVNDLKDKPRIKKSESKSENNLPVDSESIYVNNAGLVLLHPFLNAFFESVNVAQTGQLTNKARALQLLHFLATGELFGPEYELMLPKILCGAAPQAWFETTDELVESDRQEADHLLTAVIGHWNVLGQTSPDGLREAFLKRPGKLSRRGDGWLLQVERHSFDILLEQLPWNISVFRLPWMNDLIWVEWG
ncbi:contractile injection system tape measure protein [Runella sp.]|uniref:contractile injection system tape measure protein n=1 Tax=Runella sp. TaxID=1960881 RepID=UPI003D148A3D